MAYYDNEITPYTDNDLEWLETEHKYRLTEAFCDNVAIGVTGKSFVECVGSEPRALFMRNEIMADMYKFVYGYNRRDRRKLRADEHKLAKNGDIRVVIKDSQGDMLRAALRTGNLIDKDLSRVNEEAGVVLNMDGVPAIAQDAIDGLMAYGILHKGPYSYMISDDDYRSDY